MAARRTSTTRPARGRPRKNEPGARERIINAAAELFYTHGVHATGIDTIIQHAGVAKMSLYAHFESKDDLVAAVLRDERDRWFKAFVPAVEKRSANPDGRILAAFDILAERFADPGFRGCGFLNTAAELPDAHHPARTVILEFKEQLRLYLRDQLRAAGRTPAAAERLSRQLLILIDGAIMWGMLTGAAQPAQDAKAVARSLLAPPGT